MSTESLTVSPFSVDWGQLFNDDAFRGLTGALQVGGRSGNRWLLTLTFENLTKDMLYDLLGHRDQLRGMRNRLRVPINLFYEGGYSPRGEGGGSPVLMGSHSASATQLSIDGASTSETDWLKRGDLLTVGNELKRVTQDVDTNGSGEATIDIWPELHQDYADNTSVNISSPHGDFFMVDSQGFEVTPHDGDWLLAGPVLTLEEDIKA